MATNFPGSLDSFTNPSATDKMDSVTVPHADQHADVNDAVEALQAKVGADGSAVTTSHDYILTNGVLPTLNVDSGVLVVDDTNNRVGVNDASPSYALDVTGDINASGDLRIGGTAVSAWSSFTPTWTTTGTAPAIGNGILTGRYAEIGNVLVAEWVLVPGSTTTYGTGQWILSTPVSIAGPLRAFQSLTGGGTAIDGSLGNCYTLAVSQENVSTNAIQVRVDGAGFGVVGSTFPFTWANGDALYFGLVANTT